jgi:hypothetical protein
MSEKIRQFNYVPYISGLNIVNSYGQTRFCPFNYISSTIKTHNIVNSNWKSDYQILHSILFGHNIIFPFYRIYSPDNMSRHNNVNSIHTSKQHSIILANNISPTISRTNSVNSMSKHESVN